MIALMLAAAVVAALTAHGSASRAQPAAINLVQRARAAVAVVEADLLLAGAGVDEGPAAGGLVCCLPPVTPRRVGLLGADSPGTARPDVITVAFVPLGATASTLAAPLVGGVPLLTLAPAPPCPPGVPACGIPDGSAVLVFDRRDYHDYFRLSAPPGVPATLTPRQSGPWTAFDVGAVVSPVETHTYYFDAARRQLRHYDGYRSDVPVVDNVVSADFSYLGDDMPPVYPQPPVGVANCLYDSAGRRWPWVVASSGGRAGLVDLPLSAFRDGPWCGAGDNRFDIDLLRVRRVRMSLRLQAPDQLRASGALFALPGTSLSAMRMVPDMRLVADVAPRNLNAGR